MRIYIIGLVLVFFISGCSTKNPPNNWQYKSAKAFQSYTNYFLENKQILAQSTLKEAVEYAKQSADLNQLAYIYLGVCALNKSVGDNFECEKFKGIQELVSSKKIDAYYKMLNKQLRIEDIQNLPKEYQNFAYYSISKKDDKIFQSIEQMEKISSKFVAASLVKSYLDKIQVNYLIEKGSFYGYKKVVLFWLEHLITLETNSTKKDKIRKKIEVLKEE